MQGSFSSYLGANANITHLRLIGLADNGLELVRVTREKERIVVARQDQLRRKGNRDYMRALTQQRQPQIVVSDISQHEESDVPSYQLVPTMRAAAPVFTSDGRLFGAIVVNLDVYASFSDLVRNSSSEIIVYLSDSQGDYLLQPELTGDQSAATGGAPLRRRWQDEYHLALLQSSNIGEVRSFLSDHGRVNAMQRRIPLDSTDAGRFLTLSVLQPDDFIERQVRTAQAIALSIIVGMAILAIGALLIFLRQKRAALERQTELAAIVESAHDAIIGKTLQGRVTSWNNGAEEMFGFSADEAIGRMLTDLIVPPELLSQEQAILRQIGLGQRVENLVTLRRCKDGSDIDVSVMISPIRDTSGQVTGAAATVRDIRREKMIENKILSLNATLEQQVIERTAEIENYSALQQAILNSAGLAIIATDTTGLVTLFNPAAEQMLGYQASEVVHRLNASALHDPDEIAARAAAWTEELGELVRPGIEVFVARSLRGLPNEFEWTYIRKDGYHYSPDIEGGQVRGFIVLVSDITELKQAQLALEALNKKLELRTNDLERSGQLAGVGVWSVNLSTKEIIWSDQTCRIHDMPIGHRPSAEEAVGYFTPESRVEIQAAMEHAITHQQSWDRELALITATGRHIWARSVGELELDAMGQPSRLVGAFQDITERRLASAALAAARDQLEMASKVAKLGIWAYELADRSLHWNDLMYELYDQPALRKEPKLYYEHWVARVHPDDIEETMAQLTAAIEGQGVFDRVFRIIRRDGEIRHMQAGAFIEHDSSGRAVRVTGINLDISEHVVLESSLRAAKEISDAANRAKSEFLANMSHEIRTPMNAILGMLQLLQQTSLNQRQDDYTRKAETAARTLLSILNDILDFSKVEAGKLSIDPHPFSIDRMLRDMSVILSSNLGNKEVEILFRIDPAIPTWIIGDDLRLQQILINLAGNAIKFTERGEVVLSVDRHVSDSGQLALSFEVRDTGIGISPAQCERIFDGFSQAEASTARRYGGSGLGLAISQRLVRLMGGTLAVQSTPGVGSRFYFTIPCALAQQPEIVDSSTNTLDLYDLKCLVIDDNATAREVLGGMLRSFGWSVEAVGSGPEATAILAAGDPGPAYDVVFLDWNMRGMESLHTCTRIRERKELQPCSIIAMVTAYGHESLAQQQLQYAGLFDGMLIKPVTASMMFDAVAEHRASQGQTVQLEGKSKSCQQRLRGIHVLLVEDNLVNQQVAGELLSNDGAVVTIAACGQDGIEAVDQANACGQLFDVVLMDIQMPGMDGYAATRLLRQRHDAGTLPIIAMTANVMQSDREAALQAGMNDHVGKPIDLDRLVAVILQHTRGIDSATAACDQLPPLESYDAASEKREQPDLDVIGALRRLGGNLTTYQRALKGFIGELSTFESACRKALEEQRYDDARRLLHTTKGVAGNVGARHLAALAADAERLLSDPVAQPAWSALESLSLAANRATAAALDYLAQCEPTTAPTAAVTAATAATDSQRPDFAAFRAGLEVLQHLLTVADLQADERFEQLRVTFGHVMPDEFERLERSIEQLDYAHASALCNELLEYITARDHTSGAL